MEEIEQDWLFTFGADHLHPETGMSLGRHYVTVRGTCDSTRETMFKIFGNRWAFQYSRSQFETRVRRYNLIEIPMPTLSKAEQATHATGQRNALGTVIGCTGPECAAVEKAILADNAGRKIQGVS